MTDNRQYTKAEKDEMKQRAQDEYAYKRTQLADSFAFQVQALDDAHWHKLDVIEFLPEKGDMLFYPAVKQ